MKKVNVQDLPLDYALVLQQVSEDGRDELAVLAETLSIRRSRMLHIVSSLRQKGLLFIEQTSRGDAWVRLSAKGRKIVGQLWPETQLNPAFS
ncbi:winged helix DNA-binding protein [Candidatus Saccharibacteria bacterium]|nr:winged helix DNA-binding protein [Candidatus Saccharibacteria bacterium]